MKKITLIAVFLIAASFSGFAQQLLLLDVRNTNPTVGLNCGYNITCTFKLVGSTQKYAQTNYTGPGQLTVFSFYVPKGSTIVPGSLAFSVPGEGVFGTTSVTVPGNCLPPDPYNTNVTVWTVNSPTNFSIHADIIVGPAH